MRSYAIQNYHDSEVFTSSQAAIVTFLGGPMGAGFILFHNSRLVGRRFFSWFALAIGIVFGSLFFALAAVLVLENVFFAIPFIGACTLIFSMLITALVEVFNENDFINESVRVNDISWLLSIMVAGACLVLQLAVVFLGLMYLAASFMSQPDGLV